MATSMRDVAALAGVSSRTVSNVVRGYVHVSPETRERVQRAIDELKYRPNVNARSLRRGRTGIIALALPEIAAPYFAELADHVQRWAVHRGVTLLIDQTGASHERELLVLGGYGSHAIDGLIFSPAAVTREELESQQLDVPTVILGEKIPGGPFVHVVIDNVAAAREAVDHLIASGRRRIAAVGANLGAVNVGPAIARLEGYHEAHRRAGLATFPELVVTTGEWNRASAHAAVTALLRSGVVVDALFCFNDVLAAGAVRAVVDHGLRVPDDVAVCGWDDIEESRYAVPTLTTVSPDKEGIARAAVDALLDQISGVATDVSDILGAHTLLVRESTTWVRSRPS